MDEPTDVETPEVVDPEPPETSETPEPEATEPAPQVAQPAQPAPVVDEAGEPVMTIRSLLEAGVHFGHQTTRWNPKMRPYIYGARNGIHIVDLQQTLPLFLRAYQFVLDTVASGQTVLFVGTKKQAQDVIRDEATRASMFYVTNRWLGGTLTNWRTVRASIDRLRAIEQMAEDGTFDKLTKKEVLSHNRHKAKLERNLGGIKNMAQLPGAVFVIDPRKERIAVAEANKLEIPVVAVTDTNCDPDQVDLVIPGNDDAIRAIRLFAARIADACILGRKLGQEGAAAAARERERADAEAAPEPIRVHSGGDGPKVEVVSRRSAPRPKPEAAATPDGNKE
jgi:small subunit ribosomal protein S2